MSRFFIGHLSTMRLPDGTTRDQISHPSPTVFHTGSKHILVLGTRLHQVFVQELGQKYVIIVGNAKMYNILQEICQEYKSQLKWLTQFPGG